MSGPAAERRRHEEQLRQLEPIADRLAARFYLPGAERADVRQIALLGIWQAIERWDGRAPLEAFAAHCARARVLDAITHANRAGRRGEQPDLSGSNGEADGLAGLLELVPAPGSVAELAEQRARLRAMVAALPSLSPLERRSLAAAVNGSPYAGAYAEGGKGADNAIQRARAKLRAAASLEHAA